jgi:hypothetical protein
MSKLLNAVKNIAKLIIILTFNLFYQNLAQKGNVLNLFWFPPTFPFLSLCIIRRYRGQGWLVLVSGNRKRPVSRAGRLTFCKR